MKKIVNNKYVLKYDYYATEDGKIYSKKTNKFLSVNEDKDGYIKVRLICEDSRHTFSVHRLVLETFNPIEDMDKKQVNHIDGNKKNNNLNNLEWVTCQENVEHACLNNLRHNQQGENNNATKLKESDVKQIIQLLLEKKYTQKEIGKKFNVSEDAVGAIKNKRNWTHLTKDIIF